MPTDQELMKQFETKKRLLKEKGNFSYKQLEDAFHQRTSGTYVGDVIFGANDGIVTTFAVVAGSVGAGLSPNIILILGFANLIADGLSMGLGNYLGKKSEREYNAGQREKEIWEIEHFPEIETQEVRTIFEKYGFRGADLNRAVQIVTSDKKAWTELMMVEELGLIEEGDGTPARHGLATIVAFDLAGLAPLLPFVFGLSGSVAFGTSIGLAAVILFTTGAFRAKISPRRWWMAGLEMLGVGSIAAVAAYVVGNVLESLVR